MLSLGNGADAVNSETT